MMLFLKSLSTQKKMTLVVGLLGLALGYQNCSRVRFNTQPEPRTITTCSDAVTLSASATPSNGIVGQDINFQVSTSTANTTILSVTWDFQDGGLPTTGNPLVHSFSSVGSYNSLYSAEIKYNEETCAVQGTLSVTITDTTPSCSEPSDEIDGVSSVIVNQAPNTPWSLNVPSCNGNYSMRWSWKYENNPTENGVVTQQNNNKIVYSFTNPGTYHLIAKTTIGNTEYTSQTKDVVAICPTGYTNQNGSCVVTPPLVNGVCGTTNNSCTEGMFYDIPDSLTHYKWECRGRNGGTTASCEIPKSTSVAPPTYSCTATYTTTGASQPLSNLNGGCTRLRCTVIVHTPGLVTGCNEDANPKCRPDLTNDPNSDVDWTGPVQQGSSYVYSFDGNLTSVQGIVTSKTYVIDSQGNESNHITTHFTPVYPLPGSVACPGTTTPTYSCTGSVPANSNFCSGSDQGLAQNTQRNVFASCGNNKCAYTCKSGYHKEGNTCVKDTGGSTPVNAVCGTAHHAFTLATEPPPAPNTTLCSKGDAPLMTPPTPFPPSYKSTWTCMGQNGGTNATCESYSYNIGNCGTTFGTCTDGTAQNKNPSAGTWVCRGGYSSANPDLPISHPGASVHYRQCSATVTAVNGACGTTKDSCAKGTFRDVPDSTTYYKWKCEGQNGGTTASCQLVIPPDNGGPFESACNLEECQAYCEHTIGYTCSWSPVSGCYVSRSGGPSYYILCK